MDENAVRWARITCRTFAILYTAATAAVIVLLLSSSFARFERSAYAALMAAAALSHWLICYMIGKIVKPVPPTTRR